MKNSFVNLMIISMLIAIVSLSGCIKQTIERGSLTKETVINNCKALCKSALASGKDLSNGPCLSNEIAEGWVCDVAHSPRQAVDNDPSNQCSAYRTGKAKHFVEVDTRCELIKAI